MTTAAPATATPETRPAPVEVTTPIRPSEAIRLGCLIAPVQTFGSPMTNGDGAACALGAMAFGLGWNGAEDEGWSRSGYRYAERKLPTHLPCPEGNCVDRAAQGYVTVYHLNDTHHWSRERIADWLESLGL